MNKDKLKQTIIEISKLEYDWDSYGSDPINKEVVNMANDIVDLFKDEYNTPWICPTTGGIQFEWHINDKFLEVELVCLHNDINIEFLKGVEEDNMSWEESSIGAIEEINDLVERLHK